MTRRLQAFALPVTALLAALTLAACTQVDTVQNPNAILPSGAGGSDETPPSGIPAPAEPEAPAEPTEPPNAPPRITGQPPLAAEAGKFYSHTVTASDPENDPLSFAATGLPAWLTFDAQTGVLSGLPQDEDAGQTADIVLSVSDGVAAASLDPFRLTIKPMPAPEIPPAPNNQPPAISGTPDTSVQAGNAYSFRPQASDPDDANLQFSVANKPSWAAFSTTNGTLSGTPDAGAVGNHRSIVITVSDGRLSASLPAFSIDVTAPPNRAPTITGTPATSVAAGASYAFTPAANDPDDQALVYSVANRPAWASFNTSTGRLSGTPTNAQAGDYRNIVITVSDGTSSASLPAFAIRVDAVAAPSAPPAAAPTPAPAPAPNPAPTPAAPAPAPNPTPPPTPAPAPAPSPTPPPAPAPAPPASRPPAPPANTAPTLAGQPPGSITAGAAYNFTPTARDAEDDMLAFSISNKPAWATFSTATGRLSGTPTNAQAGDYGNIVISVSDGTNRTALPAFSIRVNAAANTAPTISGSPATSIEAGNSYSFTPAARDAEGDPLTFSIESRPVWASFNSTNGQLTGTPAAANAGTYANIVISVSDGTTRQSLRAFTITVMAPPETGTATLSWTAPANNTDGSRLTDLAGFLIYHGTNANALTQVHEIANPATLTYRFDHLASGTHYFAVSAFNRAGVESARSAVGSKTIP